MNRPSPNQRRFVAVRSPWRSRLLLLATAILLTEALSYALILVLNTESGHPILRNKTFFDIQATRIREILDTKVLHREVLDAHLGWRPQPGYSNVLDDINSQGLRSVRDYELLPQSNMLRLAAFGDSFVYGNEVTTTDAWPHRMELLHPSLEVLNFGVSAYGLDQAYLRYLAEGAQFAPHIVLIGFAPVDLGRLVNVCRCFISPRENPRIKPRFIFDDSGKLRLLANPAPTRSEYERYGGDATLLIELGNNDQWFRRLIYENPFYDASATIRLLTNLSLPVYERHFHPERWVQIPNRWLGRGDLKWSFRRSSEAYRLQVAIFDAFAAAVRANGAVPVIVIFPPRRALWNGFHQADPPVYAPLLKDMRVRDVPIMDLAQAFLQLGRPEDLDKYFTPSGHYSRSGNDILARWLSREIIDKFSESNLAETSPE